MTPSVAGVVLAAGAGTRLRPLTHRRPKPLCPVANRPLVDHALDRTATVTGDLAVNVHHGRHAMEAHLEGRVHLSIEEELLGTAGALGRLREWIDGRHVVVVNADTWQKKPQLGPLVEGWDEETVRLLTGGPPGLRPEVVVAASVLPWSIVSELEAVPSGLFEVVWEPANDGGRLETVAATSEVIDCGTPRGYLEANLQASGGASVIAPGAVVEGELHESVVWPGMWVRRGEVLRRAVRYGPHHTLAVR